MTVEKKGVSHVIYTSDSFISCPNNAPHLPIPAAVVGVAVVVGVVVIVVVVASTHSVKRKRG